MYPRGIEYVRPKGGNGHAVIASRYFAVPTVSDNADRAAAVVVKQLIVQCTAASSAEVDGAATANTTGSPGRLALGLAASVNDPIGRPLPRNQIATTEEGAVTLIPARGNIFRCLEDGDGGFISDANSAGTYASLIIGAPTSTSDAQTFTPNPEPNIKIDSSSIASGTSSNRMIRLLGADPSPSNTSGPRSFLFEFTDAFSAEV